MRLLPLTGALLALVSGSTSAPATKPLQPTIVLVPGAWHLASAMDDFAAALKVIGYPTGQFGLVTVNNASATIGDDVAALQSKFLLPLINGQGKDVVLYLHSYAGFPGSAALSGLSKANRLRKGLPGGIVGLVYQSAFIPHTGDSVLEEIGGSYAPWQSVKPDGLIDVIGPEKIFYNDVSQARAQAAAAKYVRRQSTLSFNTEEGTTYYQSADYDGRRAYIRASQDNALPPSAQEAFLSASGVAWDTVTLNSSHSPWFSQPGNLSLTVQGLIEQFYLSYN